MAESALDQNASTQERRSTNRVAMRLPGTFGARSASATACFILDIAPGGIRAAASHPPETGTQVSLNVPALGTFQGNTVWSRDGQFAIQFIGRSQPRELAKTLALRSGRARLAIVDGTPSTEPEAVVRCGDGSTLAARLVRMSVDGACFEADRAPLDGESVEIGDMPCTVIKSRGGQFAVRFLLQDHM
ncbi:PilZ domain-containing protein [Maricaulis sp.]|uniref:PilZ domain-containing protein n=1 Tax=Maricaulis sp. TaxID=1486257 RepID=UPI002B27241D|nr:PilZ domain-containing protein [Maricaulis sp.]